VKPGGIADARGPPNVRRGTAPFGFAIPMEPLDATHALALAAVGAS